MTSHALNSTATPDNLGAPWRRSDAITGQDGVNLLIPIIVIVVDVIDFIVAFVVVVDAFRMRDCDVSRLEQFDDNKNVSDNDIDDESNVNRRNDDEDNKGDDDGGDGNDNDDCRRMALGEFSLNL